MFALIINGKVHELFADKPELHPGLLVIDATSLVEPPEVGDLYEGHGFSKPKPPTLTSLKPILEMAVQNHLDDTVKMRGYDNMLSACSYVNSNVAEFRAEGLACVEWRDIVWANFFTKLAHIKEKDLKPSTADVISELPPMVWPA